MWTASIELIHEGIKLYGHSDEVFLQQGTSYDQLMNKLEKAKIKLQNGK